MVDSIQWRRCLYHPRAPDPSCFSKVFIVNRLRQTRSDTFELGIFLFGRLALSPNSHHPRASKHHSPSSNPTPSTAKTPVFPMKTGILRRLWRLIRRLTRSQGSAPDDTAPASMYKAGRAGSPKQLARNAKNPGETRVFERRGRDSNPRYPCGYTGFRDRHIRPLCHLSGFTSSVIQHTRPVAGRSAFVETLATATPMMSSVR